MWTLGLKGLNSYFMITVIKENYNNNKRKRRKKTRKKNTCLTSLGSGNFIPTSRFNYETTKALSP